MIFRIRRWTQGYRRWYAWFPVPIAPYKGQWAWLEWIEREPDSIDGGILGYQYRLPQKPSEFQPPDDSGGWVHESGPGIPPRWRKLGDVHGKGITVPTEAPHP